MAVLLMPLTMFQYRLFKVTQSFKRWTIKHEPPPIFRGPFRSQSPPAKRHQFQHNQVNFLQSFFLANWGNISWIAAKNVTFGKKHQFGFCAGSITQDHRQALTFLQMHVLFLQMHSLFLQIHLNFPNTMKASGKQFVCKI